MIRNRIREFRMVQAALLAPNPKNWRRHPDTQRRALAGVLREVGYADAALARELPDGRLVLIDGHLRAEDPAAIVPTLVLDVDEREADVILATLDPLAAMAERNEAAFRGLTAELEIIDADVAALVEDLRAQVDGLEDAEGADEDDGADVPVLEPTVPTTRPGDLWLCGNHRVFCGDAFTQADVDHAIGDAGGPERRVDMVATDPPYAIYGSSTGIGSDIADDKMVRPFFEALFRMVHARLPTFGHAYFACDWRSWAAIWESAKRAELTPKNMLVWDKGGSGLGSAYANTYELVGFFAKLPKQRTMVSDQETGQRQVHRPNVLRFDRPMGAERQHNAAKPVGLYAELVTNSSDAGGLVLDPFGGSGTTLIACETTGRSCVLMDLEPKWCDVTVLRWQAFAEAEAVLFRDAGGRDGRTFAELTAARTAAA